jgi:hypothetical protein
VGRLIGQIRKEGVQAIFVENISDTQLIEQIARETGLQPSGAPDSDALSKTGTGRFRRCAGRLPAVRPGGIHERGNHRPGT